MELENEKNESPNENGNEEIKKCWRVSSIYFETNLSKNTKWHEGIVAVLFPRKQE